MMDRKPVSDTWERGDPYERYVGRWSRQVAPKFLSWLNLPVGRRWLDVGCGTGALSGAIVDHGSPLWVAGVEPSAGFLATAQRNLVDQVMLFRGTAIQVPLGTSSIDAVVSGLVLNFIPDPPAALREMARVTSNGGVIGAYVWDYAGKMEPMRLFWDVATEIDPQAAGLDEGIRFPMCKPEALMELFSGVGLNGSEVSAIDIPASFASFEEYWQPFLGGQGPAPAYVMALEAAARARLRDRLREIIPMEMDGSISLVARAWAIRATVVK